MIEDGVPKNEVAKRVKELKKDMKARQNKEERMYWKQKQDDRWGYQREIDQKGGKDYLKCLKKK